jgi:hypothetical protein
VIVVIVYLTTLSVDEIFRHLLEDILSWLRFELWASELEAGVQTNHSTAQLAPI